jgi:ADP-ribose pyrophosphatase
MKDNKLVLVAGPYRSGTGDDLEKIAQNVAAMEAVAYQVYQLGHTPLLGEWLALPLLREAGSVQIGDEIFNALFHTSAIRLLAHCDTVLRIGGASAGADEMVRVGEQLGKQIVYDLDRL